MGPSPDESAGSDAHPLLADVWHGRRNVVWQLEPGRLGGTSPIAPLGLLSGSFNPLHAGHAELRDVAARILGGPVYFELPIVNADKPPLELPAIVERLAQFGRHPVAITTAATFVEKAGLFSGVTFVVGVDTAMRILDPRFYGGSDAAMHDALQVLAEADCAFLVAGRTLEGRFQTLGDLPIPGAFRLLFRELPASRFRRDVSSTELRKPG